MRNEQEVNFPEQLHQTDQAGDERDAVDQPARWCQLEREAQEQKPRMPEHSQMPGPFFQFLEVDMPREKPVRLERVARKQTLDVGLGQAAGIGLEKRASRLPWKRGNFHRFTRRS